MFYTYSGTHINGRVLTIIKIENFDNPPKQGEKTEFSSCSFYSSRFIDIYRHIASCKLNVCVIICYMDIL